MTELFGQVTMNIDAMHNQTMGGFLLGRAGVHRAENTILARPKRNPPYTACIEFIYA